MRAEGALGFKRIVVAGVGIVGRRISEIDLARGRDTLLVVPDEEGMGPSWIGDRSEGGWILPISSCRRRRSRIAIDWSPASYSQKQRARSDARHLQDDRPRGED